MLRLPNRKAELLSCLGGSFVEAPITFHAKIFDGPAVVHCLPTKVSTFEEYANEVFFPWTSQQLCLCDRIYIIWDQYVSGSLKDSTREKRGRGIGTSPD